MGVPGSSVVKIPSARQEMQVQSLGEENPLKEGMAIHSSILFFFLIFFHLFLLVGG